jgi:hypothetical protein
MSEWSHGDASDIDGQTDRSDGALGKADIEHVAIRNGAEGSATWPEGWDHDRGGVFKRRTW